MALWVGAGEEDGARGSGALLAAQAIARPTHEAGDAAALRRGHHLTAPPLLPTQNGAQGETENGREYEASTGEDEGVLVALQQVVESG